MARKTFASIVLLFNNVQMEIVSELLGPGNMRITQNSYGKVVQRNISQDLKRISKKVK